MKKIILFVTMFSLFLCGQAMAARQVFDSAGGKFSVDVPDDWKAKAIGNGCQIDSKDGKNSMTVQLVPAGDKSQKDFAKMVAEKCGMKVNKETHDEKATWLDGDINGAPIGILSVKNGSIVLVSIWGGKDRAAMKSIYSTVGDPTQETVIELEAGPIWDNDFAKKRCPEVLAAWKQANPGKDAEWLGE